MTGAATFKIPWSALASLSVVYRCVNKTTTRKGIFPNWAVRSAVIIWGRKNAVFVGKGYVFYEFYRRLQNNRVNF